MTHDWVGNRIYCRLQVVRTYTHTRWPCQFHGFMHVKIYLNILLLRKSLHIHYTTIQSIEKKTSANLACLWEARKDGKNGSPQNIFYISPLKI